MDKIKNLFGAKTNHRKVIYGKAVMFLKGKKYKVLTKIASGSFGDVVALKTPEKEEVAAKIVSQDSTSLLEFTEWHKLDHANVLPMLKLIRQPEYNVFLMPLHRITLNEILKDREFCGCPDSFDLSKKWVCDVAQGLNYLHDLDICHMDLQTDNILVTDKMKAVIGDFSYMSKHAEVIRTYGLKAFNRPPEAGNSIGHCLEVNGKSFDVWSFGMLCLKIWSSTECLENMANKRDSWEKDIYRVLFNALQFPAFCKALKEKFPNLVLNATEIRKAMNLVQGTLRYLQSERPSTALILLHSFISEKSENLFEPDWIWMKNLLDLKICEDPVKPSSKYENDGTSHELKNSFADSSSLVGNCGDTSSSLPLRNMPVTDSIPPEVLELKEISGKKSDGKVKGKASRGKTFRMCCYRALNLFCCLPCFAKINDA